MPNIGWTELFILGIPIGIGIYCSRRASAKNRNTVGWFVIGFVMSLVMPIVGGIIAIIVIITAESLDQHGHVVESPPKKAQEKTSASVETTGELQPLRITALQSLGSEESRCPYCQEALETRPSRKKKCIYCQRVIHSCNNPLTNQKVLSTEEQYLLINALRGVGYGHFELVYPVQLVADAEEYLGHQFGSKPSDRDVVWHILGQEVMGATSERNGIEYTGAIWRKAMVLWAESLSDDGDEKAREAINQFLHVAYLEINGPSIGDEKTPWFSSEDGYINPSIIESANALINRTNISPIDVKELFDNITTRTHRAMKLQLSPEDAWSQIEIAMHR